MARVTKSDELPSAASADEIYSRPANPVICEGPAFSFRCETSDRHLNWLRVRHYGRCCFYRQETVLLVAVYGRGCDSDGMCRSWSRWLRPLGLAAAMTWSVAAYADCT